MFCSQTRAALIVFLSSAALYAQTIAFVDVSVVPMDSERILPHHTVVVKGDRIDAIGPAAKMKLPPGTIQIAGAGKYLMPGLADMHVHFFMGDMRAITPLLLAATGVTAVRSMSGSQDVLQLIKDIDAGQMIGPTIYSSGVVNDGDPPGYPGSRIVTTAEHATRAVEEDKKNGYLAIKVLTRLTPDSYRALSHAARQNGMDVWGHVPDLVGLRGVLQARQKSVEHLYGYVQALHVEPAPPATLYSSAGRFAAVDRVDWSKLPALVEQTRKAGTWNCPTLGHLRSRSLPDIEAAKIRAEKRMRYMPADIMKNWANYSGRRTSSMDQDLRRVRDFWTIGLKITKALHTGGARLLIGTDTPNPLTVPGYSVHEELEQFVLAGLTAFQAIAAGTRDAAEFLKQSRNFGTVRVGLRADLILLEANPLQDVRNTMRQTGVMLRGKWLPAQDVAERMDQLSRSLSNKTEPPVPLN
jgi:imidazolonepropionase-like amidohydrolase